MADLERELNGLLTPLSGWLECLERPDCTESERSRSTTNIRGALNRMRIALTCMSRAPSQVLTRLAIIDLNDLVTAVLRTLDPRLRNAFDLLWNRDPELWSVIGDLAALDHVVVSLIIDAASAGEPGDQITIETSNTESTMESGTDEVVHRRLVSLSIRVRATTPRKTPCCGVVDETRPDTTPRVPPICVRIVSEHAGVVATSSSAEYPRSTTVLLPACSAPGGGSWSLTDPE
jgi:signal transduction histidine kinase